MATTKDRLAELAKQLRDAAKQQDPIAKAVVELVRLSIAELQESLVSAEADDMLRVQGAARYLTKLHKELTVIPPTLKPGA